ncbi:MAG: GlsB/YeaQ/YmgE family stress response membrane protein [Alistipes sp.]|nr:GlsB/YeaQ/YmgE family stress response membrane protein [Alistipes sp.]
MYFLWYLLIGLAAGCIAGLIVHGHGAGFFINLLVGVIGSMLGGWLVSLFGWIPSGTLGTLLSSIVGAIILLLIVSLFTRKTVTN